MISAKIACTAMLAAAALLSNGCAGTTSARYGLGGTETDFSSRKVARYNGDECARIYYNLSDHDPVADKKRDDRKFPLVEDTSPATQILLATCARYEKDGPDGEPIAQWSRIEVINPDKTYLRMDDQRFDVVTAAVSCVAIMNDTFNRDARFGTHQHHALVFFYTQVIDRGELAAAVAKLALPIEAQSAFLKQYDDAVRRIRAGKIATAARKLVIDIPTRTFRARREHYLKFASMYAELDGLLARAAEVKGDPELADRLIEPFVVLRSRFMAACGEASCWTLPLWAKATKELARLHVARKAGLDAEAESVMQSRGGSYVAGLAQAIRVAQDAAIQKMLEADERYGIEKSKGADEETARSLAGPDFTNGMLKHGLLLQALFKPAMSLPNFARELDEKSVHYDDEGPRAEYPVEALEPAGEKKVKMVLGKGSRRPAQGPPPTTVFVPAAEAKNIKPRDVVLILVRGEDARVLEVKRGEKIIQIRGDAVLR
jgi:hypothetical protein